MPSFEFGKIAVIESLPVGDIKTGTKLTEDLKIINIACDRNIEIVCHQVHSRTDFLGLLDNFREEARHGNWPILDIECHGLDDQSGISLANKDVITWTELATYLTAINVNTECNLLVVMAACFGGFFATQIKPIKPAPCLAMIGPSKRMYPDKELLKPLKSFYGELLSSLNLDKALKNLYSYPIQEGGYYYELAESAFKSIYKNFFTSISIEERAENLQAYIEKLYGDKKDVKELEHIITELDPSLFEKYRKNFFMIDLFSDNESRFNIKFDDVK